MVRLVDEALREPNAVRLAPGSRFPRGAARRSDRRHGRLGSPWSAETTRLHQLIFPQMANWLPVEEREQMCLEFGDGVEAPLDLVMT